MLAWLKSLFGPKGPRRHKHWPVVRAEHLLKQPRCMACGGTENLVVHHIKPFQWFPHLELDPANLITLCEAETHNDHLWLGHCGNFSKWYNPKVVDTCKLIQHMLLLKEGPPPEPIPILPMVKES